MLAVGLNIKNDQYVLDYKLLPLGAEEHWQSAARLSKQSLLRSTLR